MDIINKVIGICQTIFPNENGDFNIETTSNDIASWDSLGHVLLIEAIENEFSIQFDIEDLLEFDTISSITDAVAKILKKNN